MKARKNNRLLLTLAAFVFVMIGVSFAAVPLYSMFCRSTGFDGTTQRVISAPSPASIKDRYITVTFDGNVDSALPWDFAPNVKSVRVKLGETATIAYHATNRSSKTTTGTATYNVQPNRAGAYFDKIQCFCFTTQTLKPHETVTLPVEFYVDGAMVDDHANDDVQNITLSYTFFLAKDQGKKTSTVRQSRIEDQSTPLESHPNE